MIKNGLSTINSKLAKGLIVNNGSLFSQKFKKTAMTRKLIQSLKGKNTNSDFIPYCKTTF